MNKTLKNKWIKALTSGKYKQGKGTLRSYNNEYCCLGVLCSVLSFRRWKKGYSSFVWTPKNGSPISGYLYEAPENDLLKKTGITYLQEKKLIKMNDTGKSFKEIAAYIKKYL